MYTDIQSTGGRWTVIELPGGEPIHFATESEAMGFVFERGAHAAASPHPVNELAPAGWSPETSGQPSQANP